MSKVRVRWELYFMAGGVRQVLSPFFDTARDDTTTE